MFSKTTDDKRALKLSTFKNWDVWLAVYSAKTIDFEIWDIIDSVKVTKSIDSTRSIISVFDDMLKENFTEKHARFKIVASKYKENLRD